jgi:hypothetical protein
MKDANGADIAIGDTVALTNDPSTQLVIEAFEGDDLVVCKSPPAESGFNFPSDPEEQPPRPYVPDLARVKFVPTDLVRV